MGKGIYKRPTALDRFWAGIDKSGPLYKDRGPCWIWTGDRDKDGYGKITIDYIPTSVHRYSYIIHIGTIPQGLLVCHHCDNPPCANPVHLFIGTSQVNTADSTRKGRRAKGETHGRAILTEEDVLWVINNCIPGNKRRGIAAVSRKLKVSETTIRNIVNRTRWRHLKGGSIIAKDTLAESTIPDFKQGT